LFVSSERGLLITSQKQMDDPTISVAEPAELWVARESAIGLDQKVQRRKRLLEDLALPRGGLASAAEVKQGVCEPASSLKPTCVEVQLGTRRCKPTLQLLSNLYTRRIALVIDQGIEVRQ
jgi:hypothetical protein